jgi:N-acetylglutamate synthase and related acetyltransferases
METGIIELTADQKPRVLALIATSDLRPEDILAEGTRYWGALAHDTLVGVVGCEYDGRCALLRSALVLPPYRGQGIAARLTQTLLQAATEMGLEAVYLFSTDAGPYWVRQGFCNVPVEEVVQHMPGAYQVKLFDRLGWLPTEVTYRYALRHKRGCADQGETPTGALSQMPNIGPKLEAQLMKAGIATPGELRAVGSREAWLRIKAFDPSACLMRLSALEGAIRGVRWHNLDADVRQSLREFYHSHQ